MKTKRQSRGCLVKKAFTLIEMLIVIAVIGILAAVILISVSGTRGKANATRAKADMTQIRDAIEKAYSVNGCTAFDFTTGAGNATKLSCGNDSIDIQLPAAGTYSVGITASTTNCSIATNATGSAWAAKVGCPVAGTISGYTITATGPAGSTFGYTCTQSGCSCTTGTSNCDSM